MIRLRAATVHDLPGAYRVCLLTGDAGQDASALYRDPDLLGHVFVGPYIVGQPDHAFVLSDEAGVAGYCLAASDSRDFERWAEATWWPALRAHLPVLDDGSPDADLIRIINEPERAPDAVIGAYPSQIHIDLLARARSQGFGRQMIETQLDRLRRSGSPGVHLEVDARNANAIDFYRHLGFVEVERPDGSLLMGLRLSEA